jgi:hypothetical protein
MPCSDHAVLLKAVEIRPAGYLPAFGFSVDMLPFGVTIPATVPQGSEIPEGIMHNPVHVRGLSVKYPGILNISRTGRVALM